MEHAMWAGTLDSLATFNSFTAYLALALALSVAFLVIYTLITPQREFTLIRDGNVAAAIALSGALLGFVVVLASAIVHSVSLLDCAVWGAVALIVQLGIFSVVRLFMRGIVGDIERGNVAVGTLLGVVSVAAGILNAACMSY